MSNELLRAARAALPYLKTELDRATRDINADFHVVRAIGHVYRDLLEAIQSEETTTSKPS